jgi:hypothetical protein
VLDDTHNTGLTFAKKAMIRVTRRCQCESLYGCFMPFGGFLIFGLRPNPLQDRDGKLRFLKQGGALETLCS